MGKKAWRVVGLILGAALCALFSFILTRGNPDTFLPRFMVMYIVFLAASILGGIFAD